MKETNTDGMAPAQSISGETDSQRMEVVSAWNDLPASLKAHPAMKRLYRALGGVDMERVQPHDHTKGPV